jgi:hypothetical protein
LHHVVEASAAHRQTIRRSLFIERRLIIFVRQLGRGFGYLGAQLTQHRFGPPPQAKVLTRNARRPAASASGSRPD